MRIELDENDKRGNVRTRTLSESLDGDIVRLSLLVEGEELRLKLRLVGREILGWRAGFTGGDIFVILLSVTVAAIVYCSQYQLSEQATESVTATCPSDSATFSFTDSQLLPLPSLITGQ